MKQFRPHVGYHHFHDEVNMNFQLNRALSFGEGTAPEIDAIARRIKNLADWKREFLGLARMAEREGRTAVALSSYRLAEFYMTTGDPDKERAYDRFIELFHDYMEDEYAKGRIIEDRVTYQRGYLPVMRLPVTEGKKKGTLVAHGGYDSFIEELYPLMTYFRDHGYEVYAFEGPGQGGCLRRYGLVMTPEWEKPVSAILDHYKLERRDAVGNFARRVSGAPRRRHLKKE